MKLMTACAPLNIGTSAFCGVKEKMLKHCQMLQRDVSFFVFKAVRFALLPSPHRQMLHVFSSSMPDDDEHVESVSATELLPFPTTIELLIRSSLPLLPLLATQIAELLFVERERIVELVLNSLYFGESKK